MIRRITYRLLVALFCLLWLEGRTQYSFYGTAATSATIQAVMVLSVTNNASASITFNDATQYSTGYKISSFSTLAVKSSVLWKLSASATTVYFQASGIYSSPNMPASIIGLTVDDKASGIQLSTTAQLLSSGTRGNETNPGNRFNVNLSANPGFDYGPGIYIITMTYTLTAQ